MPVNPAHYPTKFTAKKAIISDDRRSIYVMRICIQYLKDNPDIEYVCAQELGFENDVFALRFYPQRGGVITTYEKHSIISGRALVVTECEDETEIEETCISCPEEVFKIKRFNKVEISWKKLIWEGEQYPYLVAYSKNAFNAQHIVDHTRGVFPEKHLKRVEVSLLKRRMSFIKE